MAEVITIPYKPRPLQMEFHEGRKRWNILVTHRRFGKTVMVINELIKDCILNKLENPRYAYIAPTYRQAKQIVWDYLKKYTLPIPGMKYNETELRADFPNGGRIQLLGADNPDSLRGIYLDGVALDEYADIRPNLFGEIISPALADRKGWAVFTGTPKGKNHFWELYDKADENWYIAIHKASVTGYVDAEELAEQRKIKTVDEYDQEFECSWTAAIQGSFYAESLKKAYEENRVCKVPYDHNLEVYTAWDIGWSDDTSITFFQILGKEIRIIDFYTNSGLTVADYASIIRDKKYRYAEHFFPHDAFAKRMSDGRSVIDFAEEYGISAVKTPQLSVLEGINQARKNFDRMWIDEDKCKILLNALSQYRREFNEQKQAFSQNPLHDWTSHAADSFRYMAISLPKEKDTSYESELNSLLYDYSS